MHLDILKEFRIRKDLTMRQVSEAAGISEGYYCMIENGERRPSVDVAQKLGVLLGFDWTLFYETEIENPA